MYGYGCAHVRRHGGGGQGRSPGAQDYASPAAHDPDLGERFRLDDPDALRWVHVGGRPNRGDPT
ncbi:hypothetical protein ACOZ38_31050 [Sphaerisporangium viridialbum]|uniref:hypothetical protein n=1 Tax=Sphaerisporangium viridialbum TaxID=46189 RepID=UPI003C751020